MSICDNTTVNQETTLKLQSIRKTKTCRNACKKTFNDPKIRRSTAVLYKKSTAVPVLGSLPSIDGIGTKKVPRYFCTRYCPSLFRFSMQETIFLPKLVKWHIDSKVL